ncbi:MAG TPA: nickel-binding protein [Gaiellaceae bacterium]|nr:nickel-binding protein [Gaiellaceae bacterium]
MARYLVVRRFDVDEDEIPRLQRVFRERVGTFSDTVWEHSHVTVDADGLVRSFCVYQAPDEEALRRHASVLGEHQIEAVYEIAGDVTPDDFPPTG